MLNKIPSIYGRFYLLYHLNISRWWGNYSLYSRRVEFRLSEKELDVLNKMTTNGGVSKSVLVRDLLNKEKKRLLIKERKRMGIR